MLRVIKRVGSVRRATAFIVGCSVVLCCVRPLLGQSCIGDCKGQGRIEISDLILAVNIVLGLAPPDACSALGPPPIGITQLIAAVNNALCDCQPCPIRPTATFTVTAMSPTLTPTRPPDTSTFEACQDDCEVALEVCGDEVFFYEYASVGECTDECVSIVVDYASGVQNFDGCVDAQVRYIQCCTVRRQCGDIPDGCRSEFGGAANACGGSFGGCPLIFFELIE